MRKAVCTTRGSDNSSNTALNGKLGVIWEVMRGPGSCLTGPPATEERSFPQNQYLYLWVNQCTKRGLQECCPEDDASFVELPLFYVKVPPSRVGSTRPPLSLESSHPAPG